MNTRYWNKKKYKFKVILGLDVCVVLNCANISAQAACIILIGTFCQSDSLRPIGAMEVIFCPSGCVDLALWPLRCTMGCPL
jgi:hypothetical protein